VQEISDVIARSSGVLIAGGNIAILLNRMRLFGVDTLLANTDIIAWSAGAMVLAERIILFHERAPQGRRHPEILGAGCGLVTGCVLLSDAKRRLRQRDRRGIGLMSRRFAPDVSLTLDNGAAVRIGETGIVSAESVARLDRTGRVVKVRAA